jgi:hypothetical protein
MGGDARHGHRKFRHLCGRLRRVQPPYAQEGALADHQTPCPASIAVDLSEGENAIDIEELAEQCTIIDEKIATRV